MRALAAAMIYAAALTLLWAGSTTAPATGWPANDVELGGCALVVLGVISKGIGHFVLLACGSSPRTA